MLYFIVITFTTVGYGDVSPKSVIGQYAIVIFMSCFIATVQKQLGEFSNVNNLSSEFSRKSYIKSRKNIEHVLLLGDSSNEAIDMFLKECFHSDHGGIDKEVVIMRNGPPSEEMNEMLNRAEYESRVYYLEGSPLNHDDLRRCMAEQAKCAVIMCNQLSFDP